MPQVADTSQPVNILYVEDMLIHQALGKHTLKKLGCICDIANHGLEALDMLKHRSYDIILMDLEMPVFDGFQTTKHIRNDLQLDTPIIAFTTNTSEQDVKDCLDAGMNDHVGKPCKTGDLAEVIYKWHNSVYSPASFSNNTSSATEQTLALYSESFLY